MATKPQTTFLDLPGEIRNRIYDLSGCIMIEQCSRCSHMWFEDQIDDYAATCCLRPLGPYPNLIGRAYLWINRSSHLPHDLRELPYPCWVDPSR